MSSRNLDTDNMEIEMAQIYAGSMWVAYGQAYVLTGEMTNPDFYKAFRGQTNGLCGGAVQGALWLITGLHTGHVGLTIDVLDSAPSLDDDWEEIVEVSFAVAEEDEMLEYNGVEITKRGVALVEWAGSGTTLSPYHREVTEFAIVHGGCNSAEIVIHRFKVKTLSISIRLLSGHLRWPQIVLSSKLQRLPLIGISTPKVCPDR
jgi:hypothetical protein